MKIPAPVRRGGHTHGVLWSPSLQRLTNDSPRRNDWLSSETLAPIESTTKNAHPMQQMEKSPTYYFSIPLLGKFQKGIFFWWETQHASACSQSPPSLFRQAKADMPAGRWNKYDKHAICIQRMGLISWLVSSSSHHQRCYLWRSCQTCPRRYCAVIFILIELKSETIQNKAKLPSAVEKM